MTSYGQRFRRRALRRGYKVDEVDAFLERVEATIAGEPIDAPVTAQEVRDVVFRVRFGGYDEWQVDLHLDRVERQLAEAAERGQPVGPGPDPRAGQAPAGQPAAPPLPSRPTPVPPPPPDFARFDDTYAGEPGRYAGEPAGYGGEPAGYGGEPAGYGGDPNTYGGYQNADRFQSDMTTEMRVGDHSGPPPPPPPAAAPPPAPESGPPAGGPAPGGGHPHGGGYPSGGGFPQSPPYEQPAPPAAAPGSPVGGGVEVQRVDQLRRSFQPRRFGSGYDRGQVDQLFEEVIAGMTGRGPMSVTEAQLDPRRFELVSGGYFEAEVDHALQEVREILRRH